MKLSLSILLSMISLHCFGITDLEVKSWQDDLEFYSQHLSEKHIDLYHTISKQNFNKDISQLKSSLSSLTKNQLLVELMKLTHKIGDGHTSFPLWGAKLKSFPIQLKMIMGKLYVIKATKDFKHLLGARLEKINNKNADEIYRSFSQLTPFSENQYSTQVRAAQYIPKAELLNGLGIINDTFQARFTFIIGKELIEQQLTPSYSNEYTAELSYLNNSMFSIEEKLNEDLWFGSLNDKKVVYFKFRRYTSISKMESLGEDLLSFIKKNKSKKLIIDLRDNYGGDFFVGLKLAQLLVLADSIDWKSGVYVLIDNATFSAAMSNAAQFSQLLNAKLIGEPTGAKPSGYQDMGQFVLPNSNLEVTYSKRLYHFTSDIKDALYPDINIGVSIDDYISKQDPQLKWILNDIGLN
ncbi:S41 family peptidase [Thalassotalea atypica]|uniref:S41 family peptidase n=1 Tax=Thalassotalea atypica TaxID=2054316 RepID=UPI0025726830|nr:S41 family peptidase [Thalassotalea atypica]